MEDLRIDNWAWECEGEQNENYATEEEFNQAWDNYKYHDYYEMVIEDCTHLLDLAIATHEKRYNISVVGVFLSGTRHSGYGSICGNGSQGGTYVESTDFGDIARAFECDDIEVWLDDNVMHIDYLDHDGRNSCVLTLVSDVFENRNLDNIAYYWDMRDFDNALHKTKKRGTKLSWVL
jgi:hypothetical protein